MDYDPSKFKDAILALLGAFEFDNGRAWKRYDFDVMEALYEEGLISNPRGRSESVYLTEEGRQKATGLAAAMFGKTPTV